MDAKNITLLLRQGLHSILGWVKRLSVLEQYFFLGFAGLFVLSFALLIILTSVSQGGGIPTIGGSYSEGIIGSPRYINPVLAPANEVDRALVKLIYPSLLTYTTQGELVPLLAQNFAIGDFGKVYEFTLQKGAIWEDGTPITAHDVVFTISTIQNEKTSSPLNRVWNGVKTEALDELTVRFTLPQPYAFFLQNTTLGIIPAHVWKTVNPEHFALSEYNLKPIGAGPYRLERVSQLDGVITSATLRSNETFFGQKPFIPEMAFQFYPDSKTLLEAFENAQVQSIPLPSLSLYERLKDQEDTMIYPFSLPRYFALFLNEKKNAALAKLEVREALLLAIQKETIVKDVLKNQAQEVWSPIPPALKKYYQADITHFTYDPQRAKTLLEKAGFAKQPLNLTLTIIANDSLTEVASQVIADWKSIDVNAAIRYVELDKLREEILQKRDYEIFLFGQGLALEPDPFSLWHSSQQQYPGLNLSSYKNARLDKLLEELRQTFDQTKQKELFSEFQNIMAKDLPALFLYSPYQLFVIRKEIKGVTTGVFSLPEDHFNQVSEWYINTK